jgi:TonB family protein
MSQLEFHRVAPKSERDFLADPAPQPSERSDEDPKQRTLMLGSLCLLLLALGIAIWHNRDFWFPDADDAVSDSEPDQPVASTPAAQEVTAQPAVKLATSANSKHAAIRQNKILVTRPAIIAPASSSAALAEPPPVSVTRTVLPPLEVEVVAGDNHRTVHTNSSSVRVNLQPGTSPESIVAKVDAPDTQTAANVTSDAAEHMQISAEASDIVAQPIKPNYPLLARQMKVQGSVILQAMIGRDGMIQNLRLVSGPHILANAAEDAVRQWHFKPHLQGSEPVETQAKITVNFTISTN